MICPHCKNHVTYEKPHGMSEYTNGCRCEVCKKAKSEYMKKYLKIRRGNKEKLK